MSAEALAHAFKHPTRHAPMTLVWLALADVANDQNDNLLWMSNQALQNKTGLEERTVRRALQKLVEDGCLEVVEQRPGLTTKYRFLFGTPANEGRGTPPFDDSPTPPLVDTPITQVSNSSKPKREPDLIWDALCEVCDIGVGDLTKSARGELNAAVKQLREVDASESEILLRAKAYRKRYPGAALTPTALAKHWPSLGPPVDKVVTELYPGSALVEQFVGAKILTPEEIEFNQERIRELQDRFHDR